MTNARIFPSLRASSRSYSPGEYPQTVFEALNGAKTVLRYGNKRVNSKLNLKFETSQTQRLDKLLFSMKRLIVIGIMYPLVTLML